MLIIYKKIIFGLKYNFQMSEFYSIFNFLILNKSITVVQWQVRSAMSGVIQVPDSDSRLRLQEGMVKSENKFPTTVLDEIQVQNINLSQLSPFVYKRC